MVGQLAAIKLKSLWNTMRGQVAILILSIIGYVYGLVMLIAASVGVVAAMFFDAPFATEIAVGSGALFTLGWVILPVVFASQEGTLDPAKLAPFMGPSRRLAWALILVTGIGVAGVFLLLFSIAQVIGWGLRGGIIAAMGIVVGAGIATFIGFVWSRVLVAVVSQFQVGRSGKEKAGMFAFLLIMVILVPMGVWINLAVENIGPDLLYRAVAIISWTPFGAPWAIPDALIQYQYTRVAALLLISVVAAVLGWLAWRKMLPIAMGGKAHSLTPSALAAIEAGHVPAESRVTDRARTSPSKKFPLLAGAQRWMRLGVPGPAAAVAERTRLYWLRDPRLSSQLIAAGVLVFMSVAMGKFIFGGDMPAEVSKFTGLGMLALSAFIVGQVVGSLLQYDSTAFWIEVAVGTRGRDDRLGRVLGSLWIIVAFVVGSALIYGALMGLSATQTFVVITLLALLFACAQAAASIIGSQWVYPVQPPGSSPLSTKGTGQFWVSLLVGMAQMVLATVMAAIPLIALAAGIFLGGGGWAVAAVAFAWVWTGAVLCAGIWLAGRILDGTQVQILTKMASWPGHRAQN